MADKKTIYVDATGLKQLGCSRKYWLSCLNGWIPKGSQNKVATFFGTCLHAFAEEYFIVGHNEAMQKMIELWNTKEEDLQYKGGRMGNEYLDDMFLLKCANHLSKWLEQDQDTEIVKHGEHVCTELKFAIPYTQTKDFEVCVCGTIDKIVKFKRGGYALGDYKFTRKWGAPESFLNPYKLDPQPRLYWWAIKWMAEHSGMDIYKEITAMPLGFFIDAGFHSKNDFNLMRSDVFYPTDSSDKEFDLMLQACVQEVIAIASYESLPAREGVAKGLCKTIYGECEFSPVCSLWNKDAEEALLKGRYEYREWNPLTEW